MRNERETRRRDPLWGIALLAVAALVVAYAAYRWRLDRRIESALAELRAAGAPVTLEELDASYKDVPSAQNAAGLYLRAHEVSASLFHSDALSPFWRVLPIVGEAEMPAPWDPLPADMKTHITDYLALNAAVLDLIHEAATRPQCRYPVHLTYGHDVELAHLMGVRRAARLLLLQALVCADDADAEGACDAMHAQFGAARSLLEEPILISQLVRLACNRIHFDTLEQVLNRTALTEEQMDRLTEAYEQSAPPWPAWAPRMLAGRRCTYLQVFENHGAFVELDLLGNSESVIEERFRSPLERFNWGRYQYSGAADRDTLRYLDLMARWIESTQRPYAEGIAMCQDIEEELAKRSSYAAGVLYATIPGASGALQQAVADTARQRLARTALALERHRHAKNGALPESLSGLVPDLLAEVPEDPFAGAPIRYQRTPEGYLVYSIGPNGEDDGGERDDDITLEVRPKKSGQ